MLSIYKKEHELKIDVVNISNKHETKKAFAFYVKIQTIFQLFLIMP